MRLSGTVLKVTERSGSKVQDDGSSRKWAMTMVRVLESEDVTEAVLGESVPVPDQGDTVDYDVECYVRNGRLSITITGEHKSGAAVKPSPRPVAVNG